MTERKTILYAEDKGYLRQVYETLLRKSFPEYNLEIFNDGTALERRLSQGRSDIIAVVTDDSMPGKNGIKIIKEWALKEEFINLPFILHSNCGINLARFAIEDGAFAYINKCSPNEQLVMTIAYALNPKEFTQLSQ